ncbi:dolichol kinase [Anopheles maculipalpis]|uniref:dolichol kinase n=1 Tax=Anopheles maculipalpis TaxID=1496333 RepID=UPI0021592846|nr:dolichol kinase [Anopheles maculipalpis]
MNSFYKTRPGASHGWWLGLLLPACYAATLWRPYQQDHQQHLPRDYKRTVLMTFGLLLQTLVIRGTLETRWNRHKAILLTLLVIACSWGLFLVCLKENAVFAGVSGLLPVILYDKLYFTLLKTMPKSFSYGEAFIVAQGIVAFVYGTFLQLPPVILRPDAVYTEMQMIYFILQIGLLGILVLVWATYTFTWLRKTIPFWIALGTTSALVALFPIGKLPAVTRLVLFFMNDMETIQTTGLYVALLVLTVSFIMWQFNYGRRTTSATRKVFHFMIVLVYGPGLWYQCRLLYLASGLMLAVLIVLEMARLIQLAPVANALNVAVNLFIDEKDAGAIALTPIYLLVGCSLPLWLHPVPCDLTDSSGLQMLTLSAGVLSIGIGDTAASVVGYHLGRHKWHASTNKSVEGTVASVLLQAGVIAAMYHLGVIHLTVLRAAYAGVAIIVNALVESRTDQIDNLILPLVTYLILVSSP